MQMYVCACVRMSGLCTLIDTATLTIRSVGALAGVGTNGPARVSANVCMCVRVYGRGACMQIPWLTLPLSRLANTLKQLVLWLGSEPMGQRALLNLKFLKVTFTRIAALKSSYWQKRERKY